MSTSMNAVPEQAKFETALEPTAAAPKKPAGFVRRLLRKKLAVLCLLYICGLIVAAVVSRFTMADVLTNRTGDLTQVGLGPSTEHWLGTDGLGRDIVDRLIVGAGVTLLGVAEAAIVALAVGVPLGLIAGYFGGRLDRAIGWVTDLVLSMPTIIILLLVCAVYPQNMNAAMIGLGLMMSPGLVRVVRSTVLPVREELYVAAAQVSGLTQPYIVVRHILPRVGGPIIVQSSLLAAAALVAQAGLSFLGLLVEPPAPSWGGMIAEGSQTIVSNPWLIWPPGIALALTTLAFGLLGDAARDATSERWARSGTAKRRRSPASTEPPAVSDDVLLAVRDLVVAFHADDGSSIRVVDQVSFDVGRGEVLGLVGESGCGKSATAMALLDALPGSGHVEAGGIWLEGRNLVGIGARGMADIRGREIAVISQEPMVSLNPAFRVGWQLTEVVRRHAGVSRKEARERAVDLLRQVRLPDPEAMMRRYPHELSGGMAQRVVIARALAGEPRLLIADEPTTALDVTVQAEILALLRTLQSERGMSILLITHDWGVVADLCDRAVVMYAGQTVETSDIEPIFDHPAHPYTAGLLAANPHHADGVHVLRTIQGSVPGPGSWPEGCHFRARCPFAQSDCGRGVIPMVQITERQETRCLHPDALARQGGWPA
jgi:peptide/nickel transport system permease protein